MKRETWKLGGRELIILHILHIRSRILEKSSMEEEFTEGEKGKKISSTEWAEISAERRCIDTHIRPAPAINNSAEAC